MQSFRSEPLGSRDGLSAVDASKIARYLIESEDFNEDQLLAADVDMDGQVTSVDAARIARYLVELDTLINADNQHWRFKSSDSNFHFNLTDTSNYAINLYNSTK